MRVILDGMPLLAGNKGGVGYYCQYLIEMLCNIDTQSEFIALYNKSKVERVQRVSAREEYLSYPYKNLMKIFGPHFLYSISLENFLGSFDVFHGTETRGLPTKRAKKVITVHDLEYLSSPQTIGAKDIKWKSKQFPFYIKQADQIIAVSQYTKNDIVKYLDIDPQKIHVTYLAADEIYRPINPDECENSKIKTKYRLPDKFILYVGGLYFRKNVPNMLKAYAAVKKRTGCKHKFVLVGMKANAIQEIKNTIQELHLESDIIFPGYIALEDMPYIYNLADVFMHVSIFEGFGLPPLEAMACGVPVLVSNTSSLPEVVGDAGLQADPYDIEDISNKLEEIITNEKMALFYSYKGLERVKTFTWEATARKTLSVYKLCLN